MQAYDGLVKCTRRVFGTVFLGAGLSTGVRALRTSTPNNPQEPRPSSEFVEEEVQYSDIAAKGVLLRGTFSKPSASGTFPAVLLLTGAGPQDRDETYGRHKPFRVLADYLNGRGVAVLRVDDRGIGKSTGKFADATLQDFASDAEAGVRYLMQRTDVDQKHIGLIGHGEGGIIAPMLAVKVPQIAFIVLLAATAVRGDQVLLAQSERVETAVGLPREQVQADKEIGALLYGLVRNGKSEADMRKALFPWVEDESPYVVRWQQQIHRMKAPWLRSFVSYDPAPTLAQVKCPVLALQGEKDTQVLANQNVPAMKAAFARGGNPDATVKLLPGLNYLFQTANTGLDWEYNTINETIAPRALDEIGTWISKHTQAAPTEPA